MRKNSLRWFTAAGAAVTLALVSCTYDPYYSSVGGYYSTGYGDGYGYGGSNFSTSLFVSTGDSRWGYDPYTYCYYDYRSRRYYDPYLYGYYPVGYRPCALYGVPHPRGWRPGHGHCPPPQTVRNVTVVNYRNRESAYRNTDYTWARQVRQQTVRSNPRESGYIRDRSPSINPDYGPRQTPDRGWLSRPSREARVSPGYDGILRSGSRAPSQYSTPLIRPDGGSISPDRLNRQDWRTRNSTPPKINRQDFDRSSHRIEPSAPRSRPDMPRPDESRGNPRGFQPQPSPAAPAVDQPP